MLNSKLMKEYIKNNKNKNEDRFFQKDQTKTIEESFENNQLNEFNYSFEKEIDLENFLSKKMEGINEIDNSLENVNENNNGDINEIKGLIENSDKNKEKEKEKNKSNETPEEILIIYRRALGDKNLRFINSPFKSLLKPKKISLKGKILLNQSKLLN